MAVERQAGQRGMTYLELMATAAILLIMASAVLPLAKVTATRQKEIELRRALREMRTAIDRFHADAIEHQRISTRDASREGYPKTLEALVEGVPKVGTVGQKLKYLRRIPRDPMTSSTEWGLRCHEDPPDEDSWCGNDVWDVYTTSQRKGLDETTYREW